MQVCGESLTVKIIRANKPDVVNRIDIAENGYGVKGEFMYFKAGLSVQDSSNAENDYAQLTYYDLTNSHERFN